MMGHTHALSGAAVWLAAAPLLAQVTPIGVPELLAGAVVTAGAALLPDCDHPSATVARTFGWPTRQLARGIAWVSGGHRKGTHAIWAVPITGALAQATVVGGHWIPYLPTIAVVLAIGLGLRGLGWTHGGTLANIGTFLFCAGAAVLATIAGVHWAWVGASYALGVAAHIAGDVMTKEGVPLFYPLSKHRFSGSPMPTGGLREKWLVALPIAMVAATLVLYRLGAMPYLFAMLATAGVPR
ncbi:metal-dependent hydrolase [Fodinicola feengrottensis]|uniref:Metal-dependent hydrolase n=1 Tax=Fodinicola feengrottensis TaxID=435914 RepID=A0ABN2G250_9ACTN|nr:metal-dependent hydrolase [Fodinicola feengrottensis]